MKTTSKYLFLFWILGIFFSYAQTANISFSKHIRISDFTKKELEELKKQAEDQGTDGSETTYYLDDSHELYNELKTKLEHIISSNYSSILASIGNNEDVRFIDSYDRGGKTNFYVSLHASFWIHEYKNGYINSKGETIRSQYTVKFYFKIFDAVKNKVVYVSEFQNVNFDSGIYLNADFLAQKAWDNFYLKILPKWTADHFGEVIKPKITPTSAKIVFELEDPNNLKADGVNGGTITVTKIMPRLLGETKENTITQYRLKAKRGTFKETGNQEIEFSGVDYEFEAYGGSLKFQTEYTTYNCAEEHGFNLSEEEFVLEQIQRLGEVNPVELTTKKAYFECDPKYDVSISYSAPKLGSFYAEWKNVKIKMPEEDQEIQELDIRNMTGNESMQNLKGTDGKELKLPYKYKVPYMAGWQIVYSLPEDDYGIPLVSKIQNSGMWHLKHRRATDALNDFTIMGNRVGGAVILDWSVDMIGIRENLEMQFAIGTMSEEDYDLLGSDVTDAWPVEFTSIVLSEDQMESIRQKIPLVINTRENGGRGEAVIIIQPCEEEE